MNSPAYLVYPLAGITEPMSALSHLFAAGVFACLSLVLIRRAKKDPARVRAVILYTCSVVTLLLISGIYHLFPRGLVIRNVFQRLDHATIFVVIASTFTPIHVILFHGVLRRGMLSWIWTLAVIGIFLSLVFMDTVPESVCLAFYLGMGWLGIISGVFLYSRFGFRFVLPLLLGALAYTLGAVTDFVRAPVLISGVVGPHEIFHLAVIAGLAFHWKFIHSFAHQAVAQCPETRSFQLLPARR